MDARQVAEKVAEEIFRVIEREKRIVKADLIEAAEKIIRVAQPSPTATGVWFQPIHGASTPANPAEIAKQYRKLLGISP